MTAPAMGSEGPIVVQRGGRRSRGGGNLLLLYRIEGRPALLKVYRRRGGRTGEWLRRLSFVAFERRRGVTARERFRIERDNLALWRASGFDVPALLSYPLPAEHAAEPALWLEYCPGPLLHRFVRNPDWPLAERRLEVARFARDLCRRQRLALERDERRLVMKHASLKHVLLHEGRQVSFDLEAVSAAGAPIRGVLADELGGFARSLLRAAPEPDRRALGEAFVGGYADRTLLREIARYGVEAGGPWRAIKRRSDQRRRPGLSETGALRWLLGR